MPQPRNLYVIYFFRSISETKPVESGSWKMSKVEKYFKKKIRAIEYGIIGEGSQISTDQNRESTVFLLLIG